VPPTGLLLLVTISSYLSAAAISPTLPHPFNKFVSPHATVSQQAHLPATVVGQCDTTIAEAMTETVCGFTGAV